LSKASTPKASCAKWYLWGEPNTWSIVDPFTLWQEVTTALAPLGRHPTKQLTADDFRPKPQATLPAGQTQFDASGITDAEWQHLDRWFRDIITKRVTVEAAQQVPQGQGGDWFRDASRTDGNRHHPTILA
jgi:hypothetical protein